MFRAWFFRSSSYFISAGESWLFSGFWFSMGDGLITGCFSCPKTGSGAWGEPGMTGSSRRWGSYAARLLGLMQQPILWQNKIIHLSKNKILQIVKKKSWDRWPKRYKERWLWVNRQLLQFGFNWTSITWRNFPSRQDQLAPTGGEYQQQRHRHAPHDLLHPRTRVIWTQTGKQGGFDEIYMLKDSNGRAGKKKAVPRIWMSSWKT